jgi:hypothetical protein
MAGAGWRTFTAGAVLTAAQVQTYLQDQAVQVHASAAARSSALGTAVATGMVSYRTDGTAVEFYNGSAWVGLADASTAQTLTNKTLSGAILQGATPEVTTLLGGGYGGSFNFYCAPANYGAVAWANANASATGSINLTYSSTPVTLNTQLSVGQSVTLTYILQNGATAYYISSVQVDGTTTGVTTRWQGGAAPTAGNASAQDVYTFVVTKTASATFSVFASLTKFA